MLKLLIVMVVFLLNVEANPFAIQFNIHEDLNEQDYVEVQSQLRKINIKALLSQYYPINQGYSAYEDFERRIGMGVRSNLIDLDNAITPIKQLEKIGQGGENCVVTYATLNANYPLFVQSLLDGLRKSGFNGYIWYRIGGYPNPTGREIQFAGVSYSFKIAMMSEAHYMGFKRVLWLDSAMIPIKDPLAFFERIQAEGSYFCANLMSTENLMSYILPVAKKAIKELVDVDVVNVTSIKGAIFGFEMESQLGKMLLDDYYKLLENGYAFLTCFPEEIAIASILSKPEFISWKPGFRTEDAGLLCGPLSDLNDSLQSIEKATAEGFRFYHRAGKNIISGFDNIGGT